MIFKALFLMGNLPKFIIVNKTSENWLGDVTDRQIR